MPIYEYICEDCQEHFEKIVINKQQKISCPSAPARKPRFSFLFSPRPARVAPLLLPVASPAAEAAAAVAAAAATSQQSYPA